MDSTRPFHSVLSCLSDLFLFILLRSFPPTILRLSSFFLHFLYSSEGMIRPTSGHGSLTHLGRFAGSLPLDLRLGMLIHYGIALGMCLTPVSTACFCGDELTHNRY